MYWFTSALRRVRLRPFQTRPRAEHLEQYAPRQVLGEMGGSREQARRAHQRLLLRGDELAEAAIAIQDDSRLL